MSSLIFPLSVVYIILAHLAVLTVQQRLSVSCSNSVGNYTANSTYQRNLGNLLSSLTSNTEINYGFYNASFGQIPDQVNAIALCRGDASLNDCRQCITNSTRSILLSCPIQKQAIEFHRLCLLRYSNRSIFGVLEETPTFYMQNQNTVIDVNPFNEALDNLFVTLRDRAASGNSTLKFAAGNVPVGSRTIHALVQCTPDLTKENCNLCLVNAIGKIPNASRDREGGRVLKPSCNVRYETFDFMNSSLNAPLPSPQPPSITPASPVPQPSSKNEKESNKSKTIIAIAVPIVSILVLVICIGVYMRMRKRKQEHQSQDEIGREESLQFDFDTIKAATNDFSEQNKLGQGGFGAVYKGTLYNGQEIAVKRLSKDSGQGDIEFKNEVLLVAKLQHRNLVRLLGYSLEGNERVLVYEFVPNVSLDHFIFDPIKRENLNWEKRYAIICGIAKGLLYLHEDSRLRIIHRDLKASNILLDEEMNPKVADFGTARLIVVDQSQAKTERIVGTYGYMAPEYVMDGQFSVKSDVFSFGVLLLEIVSGQKNSGILNGQNTEYLLSYAWRNWREGTYENVIDPTMRNGSRNEIMRCIHIGLLCVQENVADRPTMASVILMLNSYSISLAVPSRPAFYMHTGADSDISSSRSKSEALPLSTNEASISELYPR